MLFSAYFVHFKGLENPREKIVWGRIQKKQMILKWYTRINKQLNHNNRTIKNDNVSTIKSP